MQTKRDSKQGFWYIPTYNLHVYFCGDCFRNSQPLIAQRTSLVSNGETKLLMRFPRGFLVFRRTISNSPAYGALHKRGAFLPGLLLDTATFCPTGHEFVFQGITSSLGNHEHLPVTGEHTESPGRNTVSEGASRVRCFP